MTALVGVANKKQTAEKRNPFQNERSKQAAWSQCLQMMGFMINV